MAKTVNPRAIKKKIRSVQNLKKITKAMEMVSAAKLKKVQTRLVAIRPYSDKLKELLKDLFARAVPAISSSMRSAYGRISSIRDCAFFSFAAATSSSARVIFRVLRTERIRRLMS